MTTLQTRITDDVKLKADALFAEMGISTTDAVRMFLMQSINLGRLPFTPRGKTPNAETLQALNEEGGQSFTNAQELFETWK
ncbi:MAG: type II toxin-antitoxin system antitoxin, RelB/DinJ family [Alphaproteobacteria bacterium]|nr:MAG: type II toxin-antitoxin system antitoxin, RelB/DinJ family [Alphaproteobacteria bacterium]